MAHLPNSFIPFLSFRVDTIWTGQSAADFLPSTPCRMPPAGQVRLPERRRPGCLYPAPWQSVLPEAGTSRYSGVPDSAGRIWMRSQASPGRPDWITGLLTSATMASCRIQPRKTCTVTMNSDRMRKSVLASQQSMHRQRTSFPGCARRLASQASPRARRGRVRCMHAGRKLLGCQKTIQRKECPAGPKQRSPATLARSNRYPMPLPPWRISALMQDASGARRLSLSRTMLPHACRA